MRTTNLFWPVFKSIEKEIIALSNDIHFDDKQLSIYSVKIAELLLRCVVEIEAIAKELYFENGGEEPENEKDLFYDTNCLNLLEEKWKLSKKQVIVSSANFYFQNDENLVLYPLKKANKRGTSGADWARAYQAVKHNRTKNLEKANLRNLLRAAAALYLLNLYYKNQVLDLGKVGANNFSHSFSDIFDVKVFRYSSFGVYFSEVDHNNDDFNHSTYITKVTDEVNKKFLNFSIISSKKYGELRKEYFEKAKDQADIEGTFMLHKRQADQFAKKELGENSPQELCFEAILNKSNIIFKKEQL